MAIPSVSRRRSTSLSALLLVALALGAFCYIQAGFVPSPASAPRSSEAVSAATLGGALLAAPQLASADTQGNALIDQGIIFAVGITVVVLGFTAFIFSFATGNRDSDKYKM
eukprot:TRINITY_DN13924_c0_g1_i2.p1 TRINITY_DN13924_c0_g1~~TRINITY_DN13924_c0_g1_i2.p1  ORF type:complete len:111 (-),score=12.72 TRINITY_DN13924_c0_g1_i2:127-459(-)